MTALMTRLLAARKGHEMKWLRTFTSRLYGFFSKQRIERDLDTEVQSHLGMLIAEKIRAA